MNAVDIATLVSSVGFPILACIYIAKYFAKMQEQHRDEMKEVRAEFVQEMKAARSEFAAELKEILAQHKQETDAMSKGIERVADEVRDIRETVRTLIAPNA